MYTGMDIDLTDDIRTTFTGIVYIGVAEYCHFGFWFVDLNGLLGAGDGAIWHASAEYDGWYEYAGPEDDLVREILWRHRTSRRKILWRQIQQHWRIFTGSYHRTQLFRGRVW